jgi:cell wall-associated NlpC family hydrolase
MRRLLAIPASCLLAALLPFGAEVAAQGRGLDVSYGRWWRDGTAGEVYSVTYFKPWIGPFDLGIGAMHLNDRGVLSGRTQSGGQLTLALGRHGGGIYAIGSGGLAMRHTGGSVDGVWSAGMGYALRPLSILTLAGELRYRVEKDKWTQGFWTFDPATDRRGWQLQGGLALHFGRAGPTTPRRPRPSRPARSDNGASQPATDDNRPEFATPAGSDVEDMALSAGASSSTAALAAAVVETAVGVMGTPYEWGGSDENGFDCSGLIQYAYAQNGVILPRVSRDQARTGTFVEPRMPELRPGDVLGFSVERSSRITHVGLYIGDGQFIHSASQGVTISSLIGTDANSRWWQHRWIVARRIL